MYALSLSENNRILCACVMLPNHDYSNMTIVDTFPDGNLPDYLYVNGEYVYDPLPDPEPVEPTPTLEDRVSAVEDQLEFTKIILGVE